MSYCETRTTFGLSKWWRKLPLEEVGTEELELGDTTNESSRNQSKTEEENERELVFEEENWSQT